MNYENKN